MYILFDIIYTPFSYGRGLIVCLSLQKFSQDKRKCSECDLKCRYCVFTLWGRAGVKDDSLCIILANRTTIYKFVHCWLRGLTCLLDCLGCKPYLTDERCFRVCGCEAVDGQVFCCLLSRMMSELTVLYEVLILQQY